MTNAKETIHIIATGGTIDSVFDGALERKVIKPASGIPDYLDKVIRPHFEFTHSALLMKDSLEMGDQDRMQIADHIKSVPEKRVLVLHGTDTMVETAKFCAEKIKNTDKTVTFVGSLIPLEGFYQSDAPFNLGYAIASLQHLPIGFFLCMNGQTFDIESVEKNRKIGRFELRDAS